ncbi:Mog1p/PsbP-like protein [Aulographum hederae CBS 113979]|uniref:Mog1p/PsbP-like protein n=1 Tax=Aulographum hederae CBS 113979 TaxID=1176131 RepID=A0A6G1H322_9PEZI|nr:Mog1p/PsbP-like protein [Aulographum hederae CBS 113979]
MPFEFHTIPLFGGAITVDLPKTFLDSSNIRQIPDHQEVYLDLNGLTNVIFEINERVTPPDASTDEEAIRYHLHDIAGETGDVIEVWGDVEKRDGGKVGPHPVLTLLATASATPHSTTKLSPQDFTPTFLTLIRLEKQETDIVLAVNVPHAKGEYEMEDIDLANGKLGPLVEAAKEVKERILASFEVKDWGLFGGCEDEQDMKE